MGAYQQGSIQRLCNLVPPNAAIITAVGVMHMERFKSRENVLKAKAELAAALPADGILWINGNDEFARRVPSVVQTVQPRFYGLVREKNGEGLDCSAEIRSITPSGTQLDLRWEGRTYSLLLNLWGDPLVENFVGAFAMAASLGLDPDVLCAAALNLKPTDHRLQVTRRGKRLFIDDAYNSNPIGFAAALDVLHSLPVTQRILVTPGMVELGTLQASENELAAKKAAGICEMIVIVGHTNAAALRAGAMAVESPCPVQIHEVSTPDEAFALINSLAHAEAGVLIENDLPDLYETSPRL
jgi:UDP-N-acetylmuramoyl-tripeptide--D-alanyl-D-alanine ligase